MMRKFAASVSTSAINQSTVLLWSVFAPNAAGAGNALSGTYVGPSANVTVGVGVGANVLWGGSNHTVALQPGEQAGQIGLGVVGGVSAMELQSRASCRACCRVRRAP